MQEKKQLKINKNEYCKKKSKKRINVVALWTLFAYLGVSLCLLYATYQIRNYEDGILEIYGRQQDAYVQLVLDQINLNKDEKSEEQILQIISTLDSSDNKYWTLSNESTLIFVKDVTETNRYKGFTTDTYYISDNAKAFLDSLTVNRVEHGRVDIKEKEYIVSGVVFSYMQENYQICLLTNPDAVLEQNEYLSAKVNMYVMLFSILILLLITIIAVSRYVSGRNKLLEQERENNRNLNRMIESLNERIAVGDMYDVRLSVFQKDYLPMTLNKIQSRKMKPVTVMALRYEDEEAKAFFLEDSYLLMEKRILRFKDDANRLLILVALQFDEEQARKAIQWILYPKLKLAALNCYRDVSHLTYEAMMENMYEKVKENAE